MSSKKRPRDAEYTYAEEGKKAIIDSPMQAFPAAPQPIPVAGMNDYVSNLLAQATAYGLLPANVPKNGEDQVNSASSPMSAIRNSYRTANSRMRAAQLQKKGNNGNGGKRRKLSHPNSHQNKSPKKSQKVPGQEPANQKYTENLVMEALSTSDSPSINAIPKFPSIPKPDDYPPPLPPIHNKAIEQQCFTHRSYARAPTHREASPSMDYERLEFLGDSYMNYCVTKILYRRLPAMTEGQLTNFRSQIICNANVRHYGMMYEFGDRIRLGELIEKDDRDAGKKVADIFEAYIGGILTDQPDDGEKTVFEWLSKVIAPQVDEAEKVAKILLNVNKNAKQQLYVLLDAEKAPAPMYVVTKEGSTSSDYEVACLVQGKELGRGQGKNKGEAGTRAAMQALENLMLSAELVHAGGEMTEQEAGSGDVRSDKAEEQSGFEYGEVLDKSHSRLEEASESLSEGEICLGSDEEDDSCH